MHELPVTENILSIVLDYGARHRTSRIRSVTLQIGELSDLEPRWLQRYFDQISRGTAAEGAQLIVSRVPVRAGCRECGTVFPVDLRDGRSVRCQACGSASIRIESGDEFMVKEMEAEMETK